MEQSHIGFIYKKIRKYLHYTPKQEEKSFVLPETKESKWVEYNQAKAKSSVIDCLADITNGVKSVAEVIEMAKEKLATGKWNQEDIEIMKIRLEMLEMRSEELEPILLAYQHGNVDRGRISVSSSLIENKATISRLYHLPQNKDIQMREFELKGKLPVKMMLNYIDGMVDKQLLTVALLQPLMLFEYEKEGLIGKTLIDKLVNNFIPHLQPVKITTYADATKSINSGDCVLFIEGSQEALGIDVKGYKSRGIGKAEIEKTTRGSQAAFGEALRPNTALIHAMLQSTNLVNITEAIRQLAIALNRKPELSHVSALFISEDVAKEGIYEYLTMFLREQVYLNTMMILVIEGEAKEALEKNKAPFELFQYRWVDSLKRMQKFAAGALLNDVNRFYMQTREPGHAIATGYAAAVKDSLQEKTPQPLPHQSMPQYGLDNFPREGGTELIVVGSAIFRDWKMVGNLNMSESFGAVVLDKGIQTMLTIEDPFEQGKKISLGVDIKAPKVNVNVIDDKMKIDVKVVANCELSDVVNHMDYTTKENKQMIEEKINEAIESGIRAYFSATQPLGADCIRISNRYRSKVNTWQEWAAHDWAQLYERASVDIQVESRLKRTGLIWRQTNQRGAGDEA